MRYSKEQGTARLAALTLAVISVLLASPVRTGEARGDVRMHQAYFRGMPVEMGLLETRELPTTDSGAPVTTGFMRFRAMHFSGAPPVFILPGGPDWSMRNLSERYVQEIPIFDLVARLRESRDVVIVEQRGSRHSLPYLSCEGLTQWDGATLTPVDLRLAVTHTARECREAWRRRGVNLAGFTVMQAAADVDAIRRGLGYEQVSLYGESFGSHWAMAVMRAYPETLAAVFMSGIEGPDHTFDEPTGVLQALGRLAAEAEADPQLAPLIPPGGLLKALGNVIARFERLPQQLALPGSDEAVLVTAEHIRRMARGAPYASNRHAAAEWPAMVLELYYGDYRRAAAFARADAALRPWSALFSTMDCASGASPGRRERLLRDTATEVISDINLKYLAACAIWDDADLGDDFRAGFSSDVPTVIFQGNWDISTPRENAEKVRPFFSNLKLIQVEHGTHFQSWETLAGDDSLYAAFSTFMAGGDHSALPERIEIPSPAFTVPTILPRHEIPIAQP